MEKYNPNVRAKNVLPHRKPIRLKGYDYSQAGLYFITICCHNRECLFGEIVAPTVGAENFPPVNESSQRMILNDAGKIADECWMAIPKHFPNVILHEHIVMPNHVHGIIELVNDTVGANNHSPENDNAANTVGENFPPHNDDVVNTMAKNISPLQSPSKTIGSIVRGYKIGVTKWFRTNVVGVQNVGVQNLEPLHEPQPIWQRNYHEHIIRNEKSYQTISDYIVQNPEKWEQDKFYTKMYGFKILNPPQYEPQPICIRNKKSYQTILGCYL